MTLVGLMPAPEGETPDFDGTSDLQVTILVVFITTSVLATVGLILRLYTGARLIRKLGLDAGKSTPAITSIIKKRLCRADPFLSL